MVRPDPHGDVALLAQIYQGREAFANPAELGHVLFVRVFANHELLRVGVIAGVDPDLVYPFSRFHRGVRFEMDIGHDWHVAAALAQSFHDIFQIARVFHRRRGNPDNLAPDVRELDRLLDRHPGVHRVARNHRLDADRIVSTNADIAYPNLARGPATKLQWIFAITHSLGRMRLDQHGRAVTQNFRHTLHDFGRVVTQSDDCVRTKRAGMIQTKFQRVFARLLAKVGQDRDVAANQGLQSRADRTEDRARTHDDTAHHPEGFHYAIARQLKCRRCHGRIHESKCKSATRPAQSA